MFRSVQRELLQEKILQTLPKQNPPHGLVCDAREQSQTSVSKNKKFKKTEGRQHLALIPSPERDRERHECG